MFLDDEIALMVIVADPQDKEAEVKVLKEALNMCTKRLEIDLKESHDNKEIRSALSKIFNIWNSACRVLEKEGYPFLKEDGLKRFYLSDPRMSEILKQLDIHV